jgi:putative ABC transport system permease protein
MSVTESIYRALLTLYPKTFRDTHGIELIRGVRAGLAERNSVLPRASFAVLEMADLVRNLPGAWWDARPDEMAHFGGGSSMDGIAQDLAYAMRSVRKRPGFAAVVIVTLGLGIGANAAVFGIVDGVLLEPLPYADSHQLVYMVETYRGQSRSVSYLNFRDWRERSRSFQDVAARTPWSFTLTGDGDAEVLGGMLVSANLPQLLSVEPALGRWFTEDEEVSEDRVIVLSSGLWQRRYGGDLSIVGRAITLDDEPWTVVGIAPPSLEFPIRADLYAPLTTLAPGDQDSRRSRPGISVLGRMNPGASLETARRDMDAVAVDLAAEYPESNAEAGISVRSLRERYLGAARPVLGPLAGAVTLVFLIACANVANLFLVRGRGRRREAALRSALGGRKARIVRTYVAEAGVLAMAGAGLGLLLAEIGIALFSQLAGAGVPRLAEAEVDGTVLLFTTVASLVATVLVGVLPALRLSSVEPAQELMNGGARGSITGGGRLRAGLVVAEVSCSFVLLVAAGLMLRSMVNLGNEDPSFDPGGVLAIGVPVPESRYPTAAVRAQFFDQILERVQSLPGVTAVAGGDPLPFGGNNRQMRTLAPQPNAAGEDGLRTDWYSVTPTYFATMRIPFLEGGAFEGSESPEIPPVVIDRLFAERYWPGESALGRQVRFEGEWSPWFTVVGVVEHVSHYGPRTEGREQIYVPHSVRMWGQNLVIRSDREPGRLAAEVRAVISELDPLLPVRGVATMESLIDGAVAAETLATRALTAFGVVALALAMLGLYSVVAFSVSVRTREIGIRMALGAPRDTVVRGVAGGGLGLAALGVGVGLVGAVVTTRLMGTLLFGVKPVDVTTLATAGATLFVVSTVAALVPALRASRLDPARTLRGE